MEENPETHQRSDHTGRDPVLQKVHVRKVRLAHLVLLRSCSLIWEPGDRHTHAGGADEAGDEDEEIRLVTGEVGPYGFGDGDEEDGGDGVRDEGRDDLCATIGAY